MSRLHNRTVRVVCCLLIGLLGGCQWIAGVEERTLRSDAGSDASTGVDSGVSDSGTPDTGLPMNMDAGLDGGVDAGGDAAIPEYCLTYCDAVMAGCDAQYAPYSDLNECIAVCEAMDAGDASVMDPTGNNVACRQKQAELASTTLEPEVYCAPAGPGGAGVCGDNCQGYCALYAQACPAEAVDNCEQRCAGLRDLDLETRMNFDDSTYDLNVHQVGELLQCRLIHTVAATLDPTNECWKGAIAPRPNGSVEPPCTYPMGVDPRCEDYCRLNMVACQGDFAAYEDVDQCLATCMGSTSGAGIPPGTGQDRGGQDSIGCRMAHSYNAFDGAGTHCPHAGPGGAGVCGDDCTSYCRIVADACPVDFLATFITTSQCESQCASMTHGPKYSVTTAEASGDTLVCRMLFATRAYADPSQCSSALGASPCSP